MQKILSFSCLLFLQFFLGRSLRPWGRNLRPENRFLGFSSRLESLSVVPPETWRKLAGFSGLGRNLRPLDQSFRPKVSGRVFHLGRSLRPLRPESPGLLFQQRLVFSRGL